MKKIFLIMIILGAAYFLFTDTFFGKQDQTDLLADLKEKYTNKPMLPVDHSKLKELDREFASPQEVTLACISCHNKRHEEVMRTAHWNWEREDFIKTRGVTYFGKKNGINNFCIGIGGSEKSCNRCHIGYGWDSNDFDFSDSSNIDCMACHATNETYFKGKNMAGYPDTSVNLSAAAKSVGAPKRTNCGSCHFFSGGGNNVKHGDLEKSLFTANKDVDIHMGLDGINMECVDCHTAENHVMKGKLYAVSSSNINRLYCEDCHSSLPHDKDILNEHTVKVACQTCHIPVYAKVNKTNTYWDWSTAGKLQDGEPYIEEDEEGNHTYMSIKGTFEWEKNLKPEYTWFNGTADHYVPCDVVDTTKPIKINTLFGSYDDRDSKIIPVKMHGAKQIYDCKNKRIIQPKLFSDTKEGGGYWKMFDWETASMLGMMYNRDRFGMEHPDDSCFSGNYCFVETEMTWPINHMVSSAEESVTCVECHTSDNSRLADLTGFYMPGRDHSEAIDTIGVILIFLSIFGVFAHGAIRIVTAGKNKKH